MSADPPLPTAVEDPEPDPEVAARQFHCPTCAADMVYDAASAALACDHCGERVGIGGEEHQRRIVERDLAAGLSAGIDRGLDAADRSVRCQDCGATVSFGGDATAVACEFCGSAQVLAQEANRRLIRPESLVPFAVDADRARQRFSDWVKGLWFRPSDLGRRARVAAIAGVYIPYWTFDASVHSGWTAQSGTYYYETEHYFERDGQGNQVRRTRQVRKIRWRPAWGERDDVYDDVLVCASQGLPPALAERLAGFDTGQLVPYRPEYLAGWRAEEYAVELASAWEEGARRIEASQRTRCAGDVPGDTHRALRVTNRFSDQTFKHVLLPVWIASYRYRGKVHRFLVNGQTGEIAGSAPYSVWKILGAVALALAVIGAVALAVSHYQSGP